MKTDLNPICERSEREMLESRVEELNETDRNDALTGVGLRTGAGTGLTIVALDGIVDLAAMHGHFLRSFHSQAHLIAANFDNDDGNVVVDHDAFVLLAR